MRTQSSKADYYRLEVHLRQGSLGYDLMGYSRRQLIEDVLDHYEHHMHFLHLQRENGGVKAACPTGRDTDVLTTHVRAIPGVPFTSRQRRSAVASITGASTWPVSQGSNSISMAATSTPAATRPSRASTRPTARVTAEVAEAVRPTRSARSKAPSGAITSGLH